MWSLIPVKCFAALHTSISQVFSTIFKNRVCLLGTTLGNGWFASCTVKTLKVYLYEDSS